MENEIKQRTIFVGLFAYDFQKYEGEKNERNEKVCVCVCAFQLRWNQ